MMKALWALFLSGVAILCGIISLLLACIKWPFDKLGDAIAHKEQRERWAKAKEAKRNTFINNPNN